MENKTMKKTTLGRQKIEIKKIENNLRLQVTFTKRKHGLFKKASELSLLCGAQIAILLQSPARKKIYAFENPSAEDLINRVSTSPTPLQVKRPSNYGKNKYGYEEATRMLKEEEGRTMITERSGRRWWEESVDGLGLQELENYLAALEGLRKNVEGEIQKKSTIINSASAAVAALPIIQDFGCGASTPSYTNKDFVCGSSTTSYADQDFGFVDQDLGSSTPYADQDFSGFYASTTSYGDQDLTTILN